MNTSLSPEQLLALNRLAIVARVFAGTVHEVNNALQIVAGSAELLAARGDLPDAARRAVDRIQMQSSRAAGSVHDVMQFVRDRGDVACRTSLRDVVQRAVAMRAYLIRRANLTVRFDPAAAPEAPVHGRPVQLVQAVLNVIMNAEQALEGRPNGIIGVTLSEAGDVVQLRVNDNGPGLAVEIADRLFEPFTTTCPVPDAPGLGLAASRLILHAHGGDLAVEPGDVGCCVTLTMPLAR